MAAYAQRHFEERRPIRAKIPQDLRHDSAAAKAGLHPCLKTNKIN
jgi:hypothetical protein